MCLPVNARTSGRAYPHARGNTCRAICARPSRENSRRETAGEVGVKPPGLIDGLSAGQDAYGGGRRANGGRLGVGPAANGQGSRFVLDGASSRSQASGCRQPRSPNRPLEVRPEKPTPTSPTGTARTSTSPRPTTWQRRSRPRQPGACDEVVAAFSSSRGGRAGGANPGRLAGQDRAGRELARGRPDRGRATGQRGGAVHPDPRCRAMPPPAFPRSWPLGKAAGGRQTLPDRATFPGVALPPCDHKAPSCSGGRQIAPPRASSSLPRLVGSLCTTSFTASATNGARIEEKQEGPLDEPPPGWCRQRVGIRMATQLGPEHIRCTNQAVIYLRFVGGGGVTFSHVSPGSAKA